MCARGLLLKIYIFPTTLHPQVGSRSPRRYFPSWIYFLARLPTTTLGPVGWGSAAAAAEHACSPQTGGARRGATSCARAGKAKLTPQQLDAKLWSDAAAPQCACAVRLFESGEVSKCSSSLPEWPPWLPSLSSISQLVRRLMKSPSSSSQVTRLCCLTRACPGSPTLPRVGPQRVRLCHSSPPFAHSFCAIRLALTQLKHCCSFYPFLAHNYFQCSGLVSMVHGAGDERPPCLCAIRQDS